ncbi:MAG TPA: heat-inducible transcriptional repressor HrcA [Luteitalea sp.]|nr:heat-inducible transcriptional repressor HrcA [Luteitalea sp.]
MANANSNRPSALPAGVPERYQRLLATLVRAYIERGEPVSSLWLARESGLDVSSATVRNVLGRLEELGLVRQPHTSAGRVPTDQGYRFYVDLLLHSRRPSRAVNELEGRLRRAGGMGELLENVSQELSRASHHMGFAIAPAGQDSTLKHVDLVALDARRVLVVIVSGVGHVTHKVVEVVDAIEPSELSQAANYLNAEFAGLPVAEVRERILERLQEERALYDRLLARALRFASETLGDMGTSGTQFFVHGTSSLLEAANTEDVRVPLATLRTLLAMMEEKHRLVQILNEYLDSPGLTVVIGTEHTEPGLQNLSLVASTYVDSGRQGVVGVIGPTRMRYSRSIAAVDSASRAVTRVLVGDVTSGEPS